jgi:hypothetical protein
MRRIIERKVTLGQFARCSLALKPGGSPLANDSDVS